jgi:hypothetical protein
LSILWHGKFNKKFKIQIQLVGQQVHTWATLMNIIENSITLYAPIHNACFKKKHENFVNFTHLIIYLQVAHLIFYKLIMGHHTL